ncbi:MAG TPA: hypothetical protein VN688_02120 [Gemmataceae bacterium]|nr:hypothetical protein [Gemmataceae bacterium]
MASKDEGRWITVGARSSGGEDGDGKKHGGSPIFIRNGRVEKGAPALVGKKLGAFKEPAEHGTTRQQQNKAKGYDRAVWSKKARAAGIAPEHLNQLADSIRHHDREHIEQRKLLVQRARQLLRHHGYDAGALTTNLRSGRVEDADSIPGLDVVADSLHRSFPEQFAGFENDPADRLKDMLTEGNPEPIDAYSAYQHAFDELEGHGAGTDDESGHEPDDRPLDDDEPEPDPWNLYKPQQEAIPPSPHHASKIDAAWERFQSGAQATGKGGLFGANDLAGRHGFGKLPDGVSVLLTEGRYAGHTAKIVRDRDNRRIAAEIDGAPQLGLIPVDHNSVEPLNSAQSWRTEAAAAPSEQHNLFGANAFLPPRHDDDSVPFSRTERPAMRSAWDDLSPRELNARACRVAQFARDMPALDEGDRFAKSDALDLLLGGSDPATVEQQIKQARQAIQNGDSSLDEAVQQLASTLGAPTGQPDANASQRLEAIVRRALATGASLAQAAAQTGDNDAATQPQREPMTYSRRAQGLQHWRERFASGSRR